MISESSTESNMLKIMLSVIIAVCMIVASVSTWRLTRATTSTDETTIIKTEFHETTVAVTASTYTVPMRSGENLNCHRDTRNNLICHRNDSSRKIYKYPNTRSRRDLSIETRKINHSVTVIVQKSFNQPIIYINNSILCIA